MNRLHNMPFGANVLVDGRVLFQLWAPAARQVDVILQNSVRSRSQHEPDKNTYLTMTAEPTGWFRLITDKASYGSLYYYRINGETLVPDPASRFQPYDVHGPSEVIDPTSWYWRDVNWHGRPWEEAIIYELHVGTFSQQGNFDGIKEKLKYLRELGVTAIELMPVAAFPGMRNWGYDGVYLFAPDKQYGRPEELKALVESAHECGLMVFLDVVYNHFGPEGNYLHIYAPEFFTQRHQTPWGAAINYDGASSEQVRQFFIHNALYWLEEYHLDGLRFDAVHAIIDDSYPDILSELAQSIHNHFADSRHIHLILENDKNEAHYLNRNSINNPQRYTAQWNDDIHHVLHLLLTGESNGYYMDYADDPIHYLGRCLVEGFAYQGECSIYRDNKPRGEPSSDLPTTAFVSFLQNHDQVGNRAFGERISTLARPEQIRAALVLLLLSPLPPLLFMGEEWGCTQPFPFFCDFDDDLAEKIITGRKQEFSNFPQFKDTSARDRIPNPIDPETFEQAKLDWNACSLPEHKYWYQLHRKLITIRKLELIPRLYNISVQQKRFSTLSKRALSAQWKLDDDSELFLITNLDDNILRNITLPTGRILYTTHDEISGLHDIDTLPPWSVIWYLHIRDTIT